MAFKRVIVAYGDSIVMDKTLDAALAQVFIEQAEKDGGKAISAIAKASRSGGKLESRALAALRRAKKQQRAGDWSGYGKSLKELEKLLQEMNQP